MKGKKEMLQEKNLKKKVYPNNKNPPEADTQQKDGQNRK